jgi:hypothetical protein
LPESKPKFEITPAILIIAAALLAAGGAVAWLTWGPKPAPPAPGVLTAEAKQYLGQLHLKNVAMQAAENYVQGRVVEITGDITNSGPRKIALIEVTCYFRNVQGQPIQRERVMVTGGRKGPLDPGATKPFRLAFDNLSAEWNQALPDLVIAQIQFE